MTISIPIISEFDGKGIAKAKQEFKQLEGVGAKAGFVMKKAMLPATAALGALAVAAKSAVNEASDLGESVNAVAVTFGKSSKEILKLSDAAAKSVGLSKKDFNALAVQFSSFATKIAGDSGDVSKVLEKITGRAADFASVMNIDVADAAAKFQSGLAGEAEPLKQFGIDISQTAIEAFALANNLGTATKKGVELTEAEKVMARYGAIMEQTEKTSGDFANTSDSLANRQRILTAEMTNFKATMGEALLPAIEKVAAVASKFSDWAQKNPETFKILAAAIGAIAISVLAINAAMALNPISAIAIGVVALIAGVVLAYKRFETFRNIVDTIFSGIKIGFGLVVTYLKTVAGIYKAIFNGIASGWNNTIGKLSFSIPNIPGLPGRGTKIEVPKIPMLAQGGIVTSPTLAMIGEGRGPEAVIPLDRMGEFGMGGGNNVTINVNGGDPNAVVDALVKYSRQNGSLPPQVRIAS
jgi:hypothetical protein